MRRKLQCSKRKWERVASEEAIAAGLEPSKVLAGDRTRPYLQARWKAFQRLLDAGCSSAQIGKASGFNHTTVLHACSASMRQRRIDRYLLTRPYKSPYRAYSVFAQTEAA